MVHQASKVSRVKARSAEFLQDLCNPKNHAVAVKSEYLNWKESEMFDGESSSDDDCDSDHSEEGELQIVRI